MKNRTKAFVFIIIFLIALGIVVAFLAQKRAEEREELEANITEEIIEEEEPRYIIERPVIKDWQFVFIVIVLVFVALVIAKPHWFRKLPIKRYKDAQHYWREVYERMLVDHKELLTGSSDKMIYPKHHFIKGNYYFAQIPKELLNYPESGGLPKVVVFNRDLGVIESPNEPVDMVSPLTHRSAVKYLTDKYVKKKEIEPPKEAMPSVIVTPTGVYPGEY